MRGSLETIPPYNHTVCYPTEVTTIENIPNSPNYGAVLINNTYYMANSDKSIPVGWKYAQRMIVKYFETDYGGLAMYKVADDTSILEIFVGDDPYDRIHVTKHHYGKTDGPYMENILLGASGEARFNYSIYIQGNIIRNGATVATASNSIMSISNPDENSNWQY